MAHVKLPKGAKASDLIKELDKCIQRFGDLPLTGDFDDSIIALDVLDDMSGTAKSKEDAKSLYLQVY